MRHCSPPSSTGTLALGLVIACLAVAAAIARRAANPEKMEQAYPAAVLAMAALVLTCTLLTMETYHFFTLREATGLI